MTEQNGLKSEASISHTEEGPLGSLSNDERVLARFGKKQQLRVCSSQFWGNSSAHQSSSVASERFLQSA